MRVEKKKHLPIDSIGHSHNSVTFKTYPHFVANIPGLFVFYISFPSSSFDPFMDRQRVPILRFKEARKINLIPFRGISNGHHGQ